jgi:hypothetical protein
VSLLFTESTAWTIILRDAGTPSGPERYLMGLMLGFFVIILVIFATKHVETTGHRGWLIASMSAIAIIAFAATMVRVQNALAGGAEVWEEIALGILLMCAALGPAVACEYLLRPLRPVLPLVRLRNELRKQLREATKEYKAVTKRLSTEAQLRRAWQWTHDTLKACYDGINPPPKTEPAIGPGIPLNGGVPWMDSASSSTRLVS